MATALLCLLLLTAAGLYGLGRAVYNVFFHPLRKFPGPLMAGATSSWKAYKEVIKQETLAQELFVLHEKYGMIKSKANLNFLLTYLIGDIVRIAPNEVSFLCTQ